MILRLGRGRVLRRVAANRLAIVAAAFLLGLVLVAAAAPWLTPYDPILAKDFRARLEPPFGDYLLGTDNVGRDLLTRLLYGTRYALLAGCVAALVALGVGVPVGLTIGYFRGRVDASIMRIVEAIVAVPPVVMAMAIIAATGPGLVRAMVAIGLVYSMVVARLTRAEVFGVREELYVDGAKASGAGHSRVMWRHILPNVAPTLIVQTTLLFAQAVLAEAALSFLGLGASNTQASWGVMLREARLTLTESLWPAVPPGVAVFVTVLAFNVLGDGIRDAIGRDVGRGRLGVRPVSPIPDVLVPLAAGGRMMDTGQKGVVVRSDGQQHQKDLLTVDSLTVRFPDPATNSEFDVVSDVSFSIGRGEILALVGESGSGKSVSAMAIVGLVPSSGYATASSIMLNGTELVGLAPSRLRSIRGNDIGVVFQEPLAALHPAHTVARQISEPMRVHLGMSSSAARARAIDLLGRVGIPEPRRRVDDYPHQFSGGMAQRVMIAMALSCDPSLIIADEPTTALDVTVQAQVLDLLGVLSRESGASVLLITHDLGVVADLADRVAVMYAGEIVEDGSLADVFRRPKHPYTEALIRSIPRNQARTGEIATIGGLVPSPGSWPRGCRFEPRCDHASDQCGVHPVLIESSQRSDRCVRSGELSLVGVEQAKKWVS